MSQYLEFYGTCNIERECKGFATFTKGLFKGFLGGRRQKYEGESVSNQLIPFPIDRDGHDFHALFQYMFYTCVQKCTLIELFFNKLLNVKYG